MIQLLPKDKDDERNSFVELRAGAGGMKQQFLSEIYIECMADLQREINGKLKK